MTDRATGIAGIVAVVVTAIGSMCVAFWIAISTFWWCPEGGCSLASASAKLALLANVAGLRVLLVALTVGLWFGCAAIFVWFFQPSVAEQVFLSAERPLPAWYKNWLQSWLDMVRP